VWQEFCRKATKLYGTHPPLWSIYFHRLEAEFEFGGLVVASSTKEESKGDAPPTYGEQLKE
jgi:hypothetical protein